MAQYDVDLREYWRIIKKRKAIVVVMTCLVGAAAWFFSGLNKPVPLYEAESAVKIEQRATLADFFSGDFWYPADTLSTQAFIIKSFPVLEQTAKYLGLIPRNLTEDQIRTSKSALDAINRLKTMTDAEQTRGTNIINIRVTSKDPLEAVRVANAVAETYRAYNVREKNKRTFDTRAFIEEQLRLTQEHLHRAEDELKFFKERNDVVSLDSQTSQTLNRLFSVETEYDNTRREREEAELQAVMVDQAIENARTTGGILLAGVENTRFHDVKLKLRELAAKRQTLLFEYTEAHPGVVELNDQIAGVLLGIKKELGSLISVLKNRETDLAQKLADLKTESKNLPKKALHLSRLQREVSLQETLFAELKRKYQEVQIQAAGKVEEVVVIRPATIPRAPVNVSSQWTVIFTGIIMGFFLGIVFAFIGETLDTSIGTIEDVESLLQVPVLGIIPFLGKDEGKDRPEKGRNRDLVVHFEPSSPVAEAFRSLRTNLQFTSLENKGKVFLVTSAFLKEGKTFNVANIALSLAQAGKRVLLADADLRHSSIHSVFGLDRVPGLTDYVLGNYQAESIINTISDVMVGTIGIDEILKTPGLDNLCIVTGGTPPPNPSDIIRSERFVKFIETAREDYDFVFIDSPPVLPVADAVDISLCVDNVILVYTVGKIARGVLKRAKASLDNVKANVTGVVLNSLKPDADPEYFKYHSHYYGVKEKEKGGGNTAKKI